ncbi:MAG: hypothetical protein ACREAB_06755 [Blastocatellia bacterium]
MMNNAVIVSAICLNLAILLGSVDGVYFHLWKHRSWQFECGVSALVADAVNISSGKMIGLKSFWAQRKGGDPNRCAPIVCGFDASSFEANYPLFRTPD